VARLTRIRAVPWLLLFEVARGVRSHVMDTLSPAERRRVAEILRTSRGNPASISPRERAELKRLAGKLDLRRMAQDLAPRVVGAQRRRRR
jgi:hypothetical protein